MAKLRRRVLIIEDDESTMDLIRLILGQEDLDLDLSMDGIHGLERLRAGGVDLVILDLMLPQIHGLAILRQIQALAQAPPVMFVTGYYSDEAMERRLRALPGVGDFLKKPIDAERLLCAIRRLLGSPSG